MKVFIAHHHLDQGGVTKVIHSQLKSYQDFNIEPTLLIGRPSSNPIFKNTSLFICPELNYLNITNHSKKKLCQDLKSLINFFTSHIQTKDILHIHNLNLGKNPLLNIAVSILLNQGYKIVNHCHDFAEDMRPNLFKSLYKIIVETFHLPFFETLYPQSNHLIYLTINSRDFSILKQDLQLHSKVKLLPNPIEKPPQKNNFYLSEGLKIQQILKTNSTIILYPVRAIRRKNIGELLLLSTIYPSSYTWIITQPPENKAEIPQYLFWKNLSNQLKLPIIFDGGEKADFETLCLKSSAFVTTSVMEGFGMAFLESWVWNKPLIGRDIPSLTQDFKTKGINLTQLYANIKIPIEWVDFYRLNLDYQNYQKKISSQMGLNISTKPVLNQNQDWIDFSLLDLNTQKKIIETMLSDPIKKEKLIQLNPSISKIPLENNIIKHNKQIILDEFNLSSYGKFLYKTYQFLIKKHDPIKKTPPNQKLSLNWGKHFISHHRFYLSLQ